MTESILAGGNAMRTREEQIKVLAADFADPPESYQMMEVAELHILEAERRAEQRVRAEIARDSERLDWLEKEYILMCLIKGPTPVDLDKKVDAVFTQTGGIPFRNSIDAARGEG